jgi:hypothetical protein
VDACWTLFVWETNEAQDRFRKFCKTCNVVVRRSRSSSVMQACRSTWPGRREGALFALKVGAGMLANIARSLASNPSQLSCRWVVSLAPELGLVVCRPKQCRLSKAYEFILKAIRDAGRLSEAEIARDDLIASTYVLPVIGR